jgi:exodeoxyribonuclease VII large subunit
VADDSQLSDDFRPAVPLTPAACLETIAAKMDRLHEGTAGMLLRAVPVKTGGTGKVYGGFIYAALKDPRTNDLIDCRIPEALARDLEWNREAVFAGLLRYKPGRGGVVKPEFRVDAVREAGALTLPSRDELLQRWSAAVTRPKRDVRAALQVHRPKVTIITGVHSVAVDDVRAQLRDTEAELNLDVVRVPLSRVEEVVRALRQAADAQLVVLTRGGGQGVQDLDTDELIGAVAAAAVPVAVALGHATDDLVLNRVADVSFPTPTALGAWLRGVVEEKRDRARQAQEAEAIEKAGGLMEQLGRLQKVQAALVRWQAVAAVLDVLLVVAVAWLLFGR